VGSLSECRRSNWWRQGAKRNTLRQVGPGKDGVRGVGEGRSICKGFGALMKVINVLCRK
jgi:hypothetical protein